MRLIRLKAIARKELLHVVRDPRSLGLALVIPMLLLSLFGYALTLDVNNVPLIVWDQDETPVSREFISAFSASRYFAVAGQARNYREVERAVDTRLALAALVIPRGFAGKLESGVNAPAQFIVDGSDSNTAAIATGYAEGVVAGFSRLVAVRTTQRMGVQMPEAPVETRPRVWFNTDMESRNFIVPGLIAIIMMLISALLAAMTVAREWENGTMEQLVSTPVKPVELIVGKLIPYFAIGIADVLMVVLVGEFVFKVPLRGNVILLFFAAAVFLVGALSIGIMVSTFTKNQIVANQLSMILTYVPSLLLSGFMFTVASMPKALQAISHCLPATYFIRVLRGIYLKGVGLEVLGFEMAVLTAFAVLVLFVAVLGFRKKLA
jgi:ABC-2 type transport system permease protein